MYAAGFTDTGNARSINQDAIFVANEPVGPLPNLFIVADGMGGHNAGEVASSQAVEAVVDYIRKFKVAELVQPDNYLDLLVTAAQEANSKVCKLAEDNSAMEGMGTTLTACTITGEKVIIIHVGDSRVYAISPSGITQITNDHTHIEEMLQAGQITAKEAATHPSRHVITRALGVPGDFKMDGLIYPLGDIAAILLCSDGLSNMLNNGKIKEIVDIESFVEHRAKLLIKEANAHGGHDNISAILIDIK